MSEKTAFVLDMDRNRAARSKRIAHLKSLGYKIVPARHRDLSMGRCLRHNFDLVMVHAGGKGMEATEAMAFCDELLSQKPNQKVLLYSDKPLTEKRDYMTNDLLGSAQKLNRHEPELAAA